MIGSSVQSFVVSLGDHAISRGVSVPRCQAGVIYSVDIDDVYEVGDTAVFLEPPAACRRYPIKLATLLVAQSWLISLS